MEIDRKAKNANERIFFYCVSAASAPVPCRWRELVVPVWSQCAVRKALYFKILRAGVCASPRQSAPLSCQSVR